MKTKTEKLKKNKTKNQNTIKSQETDHITEQQQLQQSTEYSPTQKKQQQHINAYDDLIR
jgi:hypothetical protein